MRCASCGKQADLGEPFTVVVKTLPTGKHEEITVCQRCRPSFRKIEFLFQMLDGTTTYTSAERPPFWRNDVPLSPLRDQKQFPLVEQLPLHTFPLIEDFDIILEGITAKHRQEDHLPPHYSAYFFSPSHGFLASLLEDSPEELSRPDFIIPHGDFNTPYFDLDQGWNIFIVEDHAFVYIVTGNWEAGEAQRTWFKVERNRYYSQWEKTIERCRALCSSEA